MSAAARIRVIYGDTDMMGVAYYGNYLRWFEAGRNELIRGRGYTYKRMEDQGLILPVAEAHVKYLKSAFYDDLLDVVTRTREIGRVRISFEYEVWRVDAGAAGDPGSGRRVELVATGWTEHACLAREGFKPTRLPEEVVRLLREEDP